MRLSFADASLASLDALTGFDALALLVFEDERPLRGLAGFVDWRLCGALSRILLGGRFSGAQGDALLFPVVGRLTGERVFCFGAGRKAELGKSGFTAASRRLGQALAMAGARAFVSELPAVGEVDEPERVRIFLAEVAASFKGERIVLFGDSRALAKAFQQVARELPQVQLERQVVAVSASAPAPPRPPFKAAR
jgi:hypothetical protein